MTNNEDTVEADEEGKEGEGEVAEEAKEDAAVDHKIGCLLYTSPSPRDRHRSRMPSSA